MLDVSVIVDLWLNENAADDTASLFDEARENNARLWIAATALATLDYVARCALKRKGLAADVVTEKVPALMTHLLQRVSVLSAYGFEQADIYAQAKDFEDAQIAASIRSLHGADACIVTEDARFDSLGISCKKPAEALAWMRTTSSSSAPIPFIDLAAQQHILRPAVEYRVETVLRHGQYIMGPEVVELEQRLADFVGVKHCIGVASGTDALLIALMALGIQADDEVITTPFSFIATAETIVLLGAKPVFVDIDPRTYNLDPNLLEAAITPLTKAIMPVSLYGQCADFDAINAVAEKYQLPVIEDAAQSFGATYKGRQSCALSTIGCTSFFPSKPLGCYGDGGACFTDDDDLAQAMREIRVHGQSKRYYHTRIGINGRLDTLQAAVLLAKLDVFPQELTLRQVIGAQYSELLQDSEVVTPFIAPGNTSVYAQYTIQTQERSAIQAKLKAAGIPSMVHYPLLLSEQSALKDKKYFPNAKILPCNVLSLPMHPYLALNSQKTIVSILLHN